MTLSVIGSGFGRTGTRSLKDALEQLGFGPCHHMEEVFPNPAQIDYWCAVARGEAVDWADVFEGYGAQIDWPGAHVWRELAAAYPDAKIVHSVRPEAAWWNSFNGTIGKFLAIGHTLALPPNIIRMGAAVGQMVGEQTFNGRAADRDHAIAVFRQREIDVRAAIPPERLLVFDVAEGWEPLCAFLGVTVPDTPFPRTNNRDDFWAHFGGEPA